MTLCLSRVTPVLAFWVVAGQFTKEILQGQDVKVKLLSMDQVREGVDTRRSHLPV